MRAEVLGMMGVHTAIAKDLDMDNATFTTSDLTTFCRLDDLGLRVTGQHVGSDRATLVCRPVDPDDWAAPLLLPRPGP